ncbi:MAG: sugar O-acetyltransferase, partial [Clostridia bacterium]
EDEVEKRGTLIKQLLGGAGEDAWLEPSIKFDYGCNTFVGKNFYANFNFTVLDSSKVAIGDDCFIGPNVSIVTAMHSFLPAERNVRTRADGHKYDLEYSLPITIGKNCWLCTGVIVTGGVTIGDGTIIAAGSVVTKDIPSGVVAGGVPCKVIRKITDKDSLANRKELW